MQNVYPIVDMTPRGAEIVSHRGIDPDTLTAQLTPIRDALLALFEDPPSRSRVALQRLEVGLSVTRDGIVAFATGSATASITLTFERRTTTPRTTKPKAPSQPEVVTLD